MQLAVTLWAPGGPWRLISIAILIRDPHASTYRGMVLAMVGTPVKVMYI